VYEDDDLVAFLDLFPVHPGHTLVVPRGHVADLCSCPLPPAIVDATGAQGFNVWTANGAAAGQEIFHLHLHVLPRFDDDAFGLRFPKSYPKEASRLELDAMAERIKLKL
jgi:histidine triad (HIT) family protein